MPSKPEGGKVKETVEADERKLRQRNGRDADVRNNCQSIICIVFRILKRTLKVGEPAAHLDNRT